MLYVIIALLACCVSCQRPPQCIEGGACRDFSESLFGDYLYNVAGKDRPLVVNLAEGKFSLNCQDQELRDDELPSFPRPTSFYKLEFRRCILHNVSRTLNALNVTSTRLQLEQCGGLGLGRLRAFSTLYITETAEVDVRELYDLQLQYVRLKKTHLLHPEMGLGDAMLKLETSDVIGAEQIPLSASLQVLWVKGQIPDLASVAAGLRKLYIASVQSVFLPEMPLLEQLSLLSVSEVNGTFKGLSSGQLKSVMLLEVPPTTAALGAVRGLQNFSAVLCRLREVPALSASLRRVELSRNRLVTWPKLHLPELQYLDLSLNRIAVFDSSSLSPSLRTLRLDGNRLTALTDRELTFLSGDIDVNFGGNPVKNITCGRCGGAGVTTRLGDDTPCGDGIMRMMTAGVVLEGHCGTPLSLRLRPLTGLQLTDFQVAQRCPRLCQCPDNSTLQCTRAGLAEWPPLSSEVRRAYLAGNSLSSVPRLPPNLLRLDLSDNPLGPSSSLSLLRFEGSVSVTCRCDELLELLYAGESAGEILCARTESNQTAGGVKAAARACVARREEVEARRSGAAGALVAALLMSTAAVSLLYYKCRSRIERCVTRSLRSEDWSRLYDVLVVSSEEAEQWGAEVSAGLRERGLSVRCGSQWLAGEYVPATMATTIRACRRSVLVCGGPQGALRMARLEESSHPLHRVILLRRSADRVDDSGSERHTCLFDDDPLFWEKLMKVMPRCEEKRRIYTIS